jgi:hypothetical protein
MNPLNISPEAKANLSMDFLQWLSEQNYRIHQPLCNDLLGLPIQVNYPQLMADYLNLDWGQALALARLPAIENRLINPGRNVDETPPMPTAEDLVQAFILSRQTFRH